MPSEQALGHTVWIDRSTFAEGRAMEAMRLEPHGVYPTYSIWGSQVGDQDRLGK